MKTFLIAALAVAAAVGQPAAARVFTMTYTGTVGNNGYGAYDAIGLFGAAGADLTGAPFSAVFTVDDATPGAESYAGKLTGTDNDITYIRGGSDYATVAIPVTASLTINGASFALNALNASEASLANRIDGYRPGYTSYDQYLNYVAGSGGSLFILLSATLAGGASPDFVLDPDYRGAVDFDVAPPIEQVAHFSIYVNGDPYHVATGQLDVAHLTVAEVTPVPEPGEWAMLLAGLGIAGYATRRTREGRGPRNSAVRSSLASARV